MLGIFSFTQMGLDGAVYQMLNHGISTGALFVLVGFMYERRHSLEIADYGGVATAAPWLSTIFLITTLASIGLPMLNNFVGEFLVLQGAAQANFTWTVFAAIGVILSACYMLWLYQRVFFGELSDEVKHHMPDFNAREWACMVPLVVMMVWMGIYTQTFLPAVSEANAQILDQSKMNVPLRVAVPRRGRHAWRLADPCPLTSRRAATICCALRPRSILTIAGTLLMVLDPLFAKRLPEAVRTPFDRRAARAPSPAPSALIRSPGSPSRTCWWSMASRTFFRVLVLAIGILTVLASYRYLDRENAETGRVSRAASFLPLSGQCLMVAANDLIMIFIGLEISSIATYILAGYLRDDKRNNEAALKYFLLGSFATAFLLYGVALIYGVTGTTKLDEIRTVLSTPGDVPSFGDGRRCRGADVRRTRLQGFRRAISDLGAGRLSGRSRAGQRLPGHRSESRGLRYLPAHLSDRVSADRRRMGAAHLDLRAAVDDHRQLRRAHPEPTSSACWPTARSRTPATFWWRSPRSSEIGTAAAMFYLAAYALMNIGAFAVVITSGGQGRDAI